MAGQCAGEALSEQESPDIIKERLDNKQEWLDSAQERHYSEQESLDIIKERLDNKHEWLDAVRRRGTKRA